MYKKNTTIAFAICGLMLAAFVVPKKSFFQSSDNMLTDSEKKSGWVVNGELHAKKDGVQHHEDLITEKQYGSFELEFDWKVDKACNSGLLYHVVESKKAAYETGPEYQLIDDKGYPDKLEDWQKSGADYAMHPPAQLVSKPSGQYNHTRIVVNGAHVEHWLNSVKVADFTAWTPEWQKLKSTGKWKDFPDYGNAKSGYIDLQDHGGGIWFKNIKLKKL
jgi:hypothetical protein